ncbi:MAG TPA: hypothetical protein DDZ66_06790 [Firmicutes bacterium]|jgi:DNA-binding MarR family transcriptional regulator|nr:hypothetical protein [Bacillota bacterium]
MDNARGSLDFVTICCLRLLWDEIYDNWEKVAQDAGLTVTEEQILLVIWFSKESTVTEVALIMQRDKGTISKSIYSLEKNGLVIRKICQDRRYCEFTLTERGEAVLHELIEKHAKGQGLAFAQGFLALDEKERVTFARTAFKLVQYVYGNNYVSNVQQMKNLPVNAVELISRFMKQTS